MKHTAPPRWLTPAENRFGIRCVDCREFARQLVSSTGEPSVANTFAMLRTSQGDHVRGRLPRNTLLVSCSLAYPPLKGAVDGPVYLASEMEEKWDVYLFEGQLYFARSWTGALIFRANAEFSRRGLTITSISADGQAAGKDPHYVTAQVDFLVKSHLYHSEVPHPLPEGLSDEPEQVAMFSFGQYGRMAAYATFEETIGVGW
jgi:hypothetical protein